ncbi:MAG: hypothetical protein ACE5ER_05800, partial [Nitrospinaceae bacterium]
MEGLRHGLGLLFGALLIIGFGHGQPLLGQGLRVACQKNIELLEVSFKGSTHETLINFLGRGVLVWHHVA